MKKDPTKTQSAEHTPSGLPPDAWLDALPENEREDLTRTWMLAALARADKPPAEAIEAACARFWSAVETSPPPPPAAPERPALRRPPVDRVRRRVLGSLIVLLLFGLGVGTGWLLQRGLPADDTRPAFLVLIRGGTYADQSPEEQTQMVAAFRDWARTLNRSRHLEAGEQLAQGGRVLVRTGAAVVEQPLNRTPDGIGGYFVITARDYDEALALASACPHLDYGGTVEVRRIVRQ